MKREFFIDVTFNETRVAVLEDDVLCEFHVEHADDQSLVGDIYQGKVTRVLPEMQAAFVDIGQKRTGFLHLKDVVRVNARTEKEGQKLSIGQLLHEGQSLLVQVIKDPVLDKGARLTTDLSIASRNLVYLPNAKTTAISHKIDDRAEIERLKELIDDWLENDDFEQLTGNYIVRTQAKGVQSEQLQQDFLYLQSAWNTMQELNSTASTGDRVHEHLSLDLRAIENIANDGADTIFVNNVIGFERAQKFAKRISQELGEKVVLFEDERSLFDTYNIESQIRSMMSPRATLPSGGNIVIEQTEAMVTVDVNSGSSTDAKSAQKNLISVTNVEAATEVARQIRLRNLTGIIVIDFIDMNSSMDQSLVMKSFSEALASHSLKVQVSQFSALGLVELTRKRDVQKWQDRAYLPCSTCGGQGRVKTPKVVCYEIFREIKRVAHKVTPARYKIITTPAVVDLLSTKMNAYLVDLESSLKCSIELIAETHYQPEQFDLAFA